LKAPVFSEPCLVQVSPEIIDLFLRRFPIKSTPDLRGRVQLLPFRVFDGRRRNNHIKINVTSGEIVKEGEAYQAGLLGLGLFFLRVRFSW